MPKEITYKQVAWLDQQGGRSVDCVLEDEKGLYVMMGSGWKGRDVKVYLPVEEKEDELQ